MRRIRQNTAIKRTNLFKSNPAFQDSATNSICESSDTVNLDISTGTGCSEADSLDNSIQQEANEQQLESNQKNTQPDNIQSDSKKIGLRN